MPPILLTLSALCGLAAVLLGAFGAHALADQVSPARLAVWDTAAQYLGWHATTLLALGAVGWQAGGQRLLTAAAWCLLIGVLIFSGSLFLLVLTGQGAFGAITPAGGVTLVVGWGLAALGLWQRATPAR